ncbi:MAG: 50S ribosomal protein L6 [Verrucomicrobia bacterium]|nr:50S ribosomal protein L6 [Verrucomicrobiota bacterium]
MSRIGLQPIVVPAKVKVTVAGQKVSVEGPKGRLDYDVPAAIQVALQDAKVLVKRSGDTAEARSLHGLARSLINNMVKGVTDGYSKSLEVHGVGFRAAVQGEKLNLVIGKSHPVNLDIPKGVKVIAAENQAKIPCITVEGPDKHMVGHFAAVVRGQYPPEPYKGKGIRYAGEQVRRKEGKTVQQ